MKKIKLDAELYYMIVTMTFFLTGIMLFLYTALMQVNLVRLQVMSHPLFYLVMGFICFLFYIGAKKGIVEVEENADSV